VLLLLVRHALAAERNPTEFPDDALRPLVKKGKTTERRMARRLHKRGLIPTIVLSSPWTRAWQTAGILARELGLPKSIRQSCSALAQPPRLDPLAEAIGDADGADAIVALVGHEPWLSELASLLLSGSPSLLSIRFPKSGVLGIRAEVMAPGAGQLVFFLTPRAW